MYFLLFLKGSHQGKDCSRRTGTESEDWTAGNGTKDKLITLIFCLKVPRLTIVIYDKLMKFWGKLYFIFLNFSFLLTAIDPGGWVSEGNFLHILV